MTHRFKKVSVLVPTRKRPVQLRALLDSAHRTLWDERGSRGELVFRVDDDDPESQRILEHTGWRFHVGPRMQGYKSLPAFFMEMVALSDGDVLMTGNDDMVFQSQYWDEEILAEANKYPDGIFCLGVRTHNEDNFPLAIISRRMVETLGFVHDSRVYWGDVYLRDVARAFNRAVHIDVRVDHNWMGFTPDQTFIEANQSDSRNWSPEYWVLHQQCVAEAVAKLKAVRAMVTA